MMKAGECRGLKKQGVYAWRGEDRGMAGVKKQGVYARRGENRGMPGV